MREGFDNDKYIELQAQNVSASASASSAASCIWSSAASSSTTTTPPACCPASSPTARSACCVEMKDEAEIVIAINADDIERSEAPRRPRHHLRRGRPAPHRRVPRHGLLRGQRRHHPLSPTSPTPTCSASGLDGAGRHELPALRHPGLPLRHRPHRLATRASAKTSTSRPTRSLVVVTAPGPGSGKMATCLSPALSRAQARRQRRLRQVRDLPRLESAAARIR